MDVQNFGKLVSTVTKLSKTRYALISVVFGVRNLVFVDKHVGGWQKPNRWSRVLWSVVFPDYPNQNLTVLDYSTLPATTPSVTTPTPMKSILIIITFLLLILAAPFGFIFEALVAGFYYGQEASRKLASECKPK